MADINQIIDPKLIAELEKINQQFIAAGNNVDKLIPAFKNLNKTSSQLGKSIGVGETELKKLTAAQKESQNIQNKLIQVEEKIKQQETAKNKRLLQLQTQQQKQLQLLRAEAKVKAAASGSNEKLAATISLYEKRLKTVNQTTEKGRFQAEKLRQKIDQMNNKLTQQSSTLTQTKRNIGNYQSALQGMGARVKAVAMQIAGALGLTSAVFMLVNVLKGSFSTIRQFGKENAVLAGVLGTTRKEVVQLTNQAISLGSVYPVTASEVTKLQVSFARLGFTQSEIINLTEATIQGSIALNSELDATATLVGAVVKAYSNLGTEDAGEIIDKLTLATQRSALSFQSLETGLPRVAAAASAVNMSLDETLALLGIAQDATLDASISSTSLRNILLELSTTGLSLEDALTRINTSSNRLSTAYEMFGKRAAVVALAFADNLEKAGSFEEALNNAGGTAERVAEEQMNTLDGSVKSLESSWEKFVLTFRNSENVISRIIDRITSMLDIESDEYIKGWEKFVKRLSYSMLPLDAILGKGIERRMKEREELFNVIQDAEEKELETIYAANIEKANKGDKFSKAIIEQVLNRYRILEQIQGDAAVRQRIAEQQAQVESLARQKEQTEKEREEAQKRVKAWVDEVLRKNRIKQFELDYQSELNEDFEELMADETDTYISELDKQIEANIKWADAVIGQKERLAEREEEIRQRNLEQQEQALNQEEEIRQRNLEQQEQALNQEKENAKNQAIELANFLFDTKINRLNQELEAAKGNEREEARIRAEIARQEKRQALFNIGVNTAKGIVKTIGNLGMPAAIPFIAITAGLGLAQAAIVASQPIPQFAKGTDYSPEGLAMVGEKGRELIQSPSGEVFLANNPALVNLERGSKVITNKRTEAYLNDGNIVSELRQTRKAIQRMPQPVFQNGSKIAERRGNYWKHYRNNKHRLN